MAHPNVSFCNDIRKGDMGLHVVSHNRAYSRAFPDLYPWPKEGKEFSDFAGDIFMKAVRKANLRMQVRSATVNKAAHEALEKRHAKNKPKEWAFDSLAIAQSKRYCDELYHKEKRQRIIEAGFFWYAHRAAIFYSQARPFQMRRPPMIPSHWDCSAFVTNCYYAGGGPDPNGRGFSGYGYTGDMWTHGRRTSFAHIRVADLILYGFTTNPRPGFPYGSPTHVAIYTGNGLVLSMGSYPMKYLRYDYRSINSIVTYDI